ncbi:I78 family peptidase inhibitor [[Pseudomonas] boreopolis]|uniref:Peptidase inhibitor I78 family protein n=1 Tax=Xanthomonas boreopolis TaxID=86183 RepID=A0A919KK12_9XANT|nr:hypothetical protein GCM10009090_35270 [[Pseudomonas] boreopolis]
MRNELTAFRPRATGLLLVSALVLSLAACQPPAPDEQEAVGARAQQAAEAAATPAPATAPEAPPVGTCDATQAQALVGQPLTDEATRQAQQDTQAKHVRVLKPGQAVTMEFDGERLNIEVDADNVVTGVRCG